MYVPNNLAIFTAAFAGALAGMGAANRVPTDSNPIDYTGQTNVAGAFAQELDTQWGAAPSNTLSVTAIEQLAETAWQDRFVNDVPPFNLPSNYTSLCQALVAIAQAGGTYFTTEGITPAPSPSGGGVTSVITADIAALSGLDTAELSTGNTARMLSLMGTSWILDKTSALVPDGITVIAANPAGNWLRQPTDVNAYLSQAAWFVDPINGNDENQGDTAAAAIKTLAEFNRRIGVGKLMPGVLSTVITPVQLITLSVLSSPPQTDKLSYDFVMPNNGLFAVLGNATPTATGGANTGTFSAVTVQNRGTNQYWTVTDAAITWANHLDKRLRVTSGPNVGQTAYIAADLGAGVAVVCTPNNPNLPANASTPSPLEPPDRLLSSTVTPGIFSVGDTFVIEDLTEIYLGTQRIDSAMQGTASVPKPGFANIRFRNEGTFPAGNMTLPTGRNEPQYKGCSFDKLLISQIYQRCLFAMCGIRNGGLNAVTTSLFWNGGLLRAGGLTVRASSRAYFDYDFMVFGGPGINVYGGTLCAASMAVFNVAGNGITVGVTPLQIGDISNGIISQVVSSGVNALWGKDNTAKGIRFLANTTMRYQTLAGMTLTGATGNFTFGPAGDFGSSFDPATGLVSPQTIASTWANLGTAIGLGGFGGNAHNYQINSHIVAN